MWNPVNALTLDTGVIASTDLWLDSPENDFLILRMAAATLHVCIPKQVQ